MEILAAIVGGLAVAGPIAKNLGELAQGSLRVIKLVDHIWDRFRNNVPENKRTSVIHQELEQITQMSIEEYEANVVNTINSELVAHSDEDRSAMKDYLSLLPAQLTTAFARLEDPSGKTVPATFQVTEALDLLAILPPRPPCFHEGDSVPGKPGWVFVKRLGVGGFAEVWKAQHSRFSGTSAVIKICLDPQSQDRLIKHEATVINQVMQHGKHSGIVELRNVSLDSVHLGLI
ncbi:MAG: hypothetical protein R3B84_17140 [Zavarzinella sp.]